MQVVIEYDEERREGWLIYDREFEHFRSDATPYEAAGWTCDLLEAATWRTRKQAERVIECLRREAAEDLEEEEEEIAA